MSEKIARKERAAGRGGTETRYRPLSPRARASLTRRFSAFIQELESVREAIAAEGNKPVRPALRRAYRRFYRLAEALMPGTTGEILRPLTESILLNACRSVARRTEADHEPARVIEVIGRGSGEPEGAP